MMIGDRPLSSAGFGPPVDALDQVCKKYKDCIRCAQARHGEHCIGERIMYNFKLRKDNQISCLNSADSCSRAICECDSAFAFDHKLHADVFDMKYHLFWSDFGWEPREKCSSLDGRMDIPHIESADPNCCGGQSNAATLFNPIKQDCCKNGTSVSKGQC